MDVAHQMPDERGVLRWGGLAGMLGSIALILVFVLVFAFVGTDTADPAAAIERFPDVRAARTIENGLYLLVLIFWVAHYLALYRALRVTSLAPALFGSVLDVVGLGVLAAGALPHVATIPISDLYHDPDTTPEAQATLVLLWQATQGIFDALLVVGLALLPIGLLALGMAMRQAPAFGGIYGWLSLVLGAVGVIAAITLMIDPKSDIAPAGFFSLIVFHFVFGRKLFSLSSDDMNRSAYRP